MRRIIAFISIILAFVVPEAHGAAPVKWTVTADEVSANSAVVTLSAEIEKGWYLYGLSLPEEGPHATQIDFDLPEGVSADGPLTASSDAIEKYDQIFSLKLSRWEGDVTLTQKLHIDDGHSHDIGVRITYQACNGQTCTPPQRETFSVVAGSGSSAAPADTVAGEEPQTADNTTVSHRPDTPDSWWKPVHVPDTTGRSITARMLPTLILWAVAGCLIALLTPGARRRMHISLSAVLPEKFIGIYRPGGWANTLKVSLVFIEAALTLKLLSMAATACGLHFPGRGIILALWIVIFILLGFYLLGKLRFRHDQPVERLGVWRTVWATLSLAFALCLMPGLWGAPLTAFSSLIPSPETGHGAVCASGEFREFDDYEAGMAYAAAHHRPVLLCFTSADGDSRQIENDMLKSPEAEKTVSGNFVLITLGTDDKAKLSRPFEVKENRKEERFTTAGEKWSWLLNHKFGTDTTPYLIILDNKGDALTAPAPCDGTPDKFASWLEAGLHKYQAKE